MFPPSNHAGLLRLALQRMLEADTVAVLSGIAWGVLAALCWGTSTTLAQFGIVAGLTPTDLILLRFATSGSVSLPFFLHGRGFSAGGIGWRRSLALTTTAGPAYAFLVAEGFRFAPLADGALLFPVSTTLAAILLGVVKLGEPFGLRGLAGILVLLAGLAIALHHGVASETSGRAWIGDAMFITAGTLFGAYSFLLRRWKIEALHATAIVAVPSMLLCIVVYWVGSNHSGIESVPGLQFAIQIFGQGFCAGVVATIAFSKAVHILGAARAGLFAAIVPAVALSIGVPLLGERITYFQFLGIGFVTLGLTISMLRPITKPKTIDIPQEIGPCNL